MIGIGSFARAGILTVALAAALPLAAAAQGNPATNTENGIIVGSVARCVNNVEQPLAGASVATDTGAAATVSDNNGQFAMALPPGTYTVNVNSQQYGAGTRAYVPVTATQLTEIGVIDVGAAAITGCGDDNAPPPTTPSPVPATATAVPATSTPVPPPTATPVPQDTPVPSDTGGDTSSPVPGDMSPDSAPPSGGD